MPRRRRPPDSPAARTTVVEALRSVEGAALLRVVRYRGHTGGSLVGGVLDFPQGGSLSGGVPTPPDAGFFRDLLIRGTCDIEGNLSGAITIEADARLRGGIAFSPGGLEIDPVRGALLEGTGQVWLTVRPGESSPYSFTRLVGLPDARADLVNRLDNGIVGYGGFSHLQLTNETLIHATGTQPIEFFDTIVDNTQGTIRIDTQGVVLLKNQSWIEGGRIEGSPGAELGGGTAFSIDRVGIRDVEIVGTLRVQGDEETGLAGDIILNGEIRNARGNFDGGMIVRDTDTARIVGGTITLDTPAFQYFWYGSLQTDPDAMLILDGTLLTGDGLLGPGSFTNRGIIHPGLGASGMVLSDVLIDNTQGRIEIPSGGFLWIAGFNDEGSTITGGVIDAEPGAGMSADNQIVTLEDVTITGALSLGDPDNFSSTTTPATYIRGTLTNNAEITVVDEGPDAPDPGHWFRVWCEETASIGGTGRLVMNDRALGGIAGRCSEGGTLINLAPHEISGAGRVAFITLDNRGTLTIEGGTLELFRATLLSEPPVTIASDGVLRIDDSHARVQAFEGTQGLVELVSGSLETGNLAGSLRHEGGRLVAGFEGTPTRIEGSYEQINPAAEIGITLSPTSQTAPLVVEGPTTLAGDLVVDFDPGFAPQPGDVFPILDARAGLDERGQGLQPRARDDRRVEAHVPPGRRQLERQQIVLRDRFRREPAHRGEIR